jgi:adenylate cyclase
MPWESKGLMPRFWRPIRIALPDDLRAVLSVADLAAERSAARLRLCVLVAIGLVLLGVGSIDGMYRGWIATVFALNLGVSIAAVVLARANVFRAWVPWVVATLDAAVVLGIVLFGDVTDSVSTVYAPALAISWAMFLLLALTAMQFRPALVVYLGGLFVAGLAIAMVLDPHPAALGPTDGLGATMELVFGPGHNTIRLSLLALTALITATTVARGRRTLMEALLAARRSANLSRYFPSQLAPLLAEADVEGLKQGRRQHAAILFADIRGFTALSESLDPAAIAEFLASFRCRATRAIEAHGGIVDKFVGDNVMGVFGVPIATPADAANALAAGRALQAEVAAWNTKRRRVGRRTVSIGIGIHYGQVFVGAIEAGERLEFTVIGDTVNTAQRIEELTKTTNWPLLVSAELLGAAKTLCPSRNCHPLPPQVVRGRVEPLQLFAAIWANGRPKPSRARTTIRLAHALRLRTSRA